MSKIAGRFCKKVVLPKAAFDRRSFRWKRSSQRAWVLVGCRVGHWNAKSKRCKNGLRAHEVLVGTKDECHIGEHVVRKG